MIEKSSQSTLIALGAIVAVGACLHLIRISYPAEPVFDEVHFATYAADYVKDKVFFDIHPPLGKLIYASVIPLVHPGDLGNAEFIAPVPNTTTAEFRRTGLPYGSYPYVPLRLVGVFFGLCLVVAFYFFLRSVGVSEVAALLGACFVTFENALLLDTKLILMNGMYLAFGFAALAVWFRASRHSGPVAGILFGLSLGVKLMGVVFIGPILVGYFILERSERSRVHAPLIKGVAAAAIVFVLIVSSNFLFFSPRDMIGFDQSIGFPLPTPHNAGELLYSAVFVNTILPWTGYFVQDSGDALATSAWYEWPFMQRPMAYYSKVVGGGALILTGNLVVWYASTLAVLIGLIAFIRPVWRSRWLTRTSIILLGGYVFSLMPYFTFIHRATYLYHYFSALLFAIGFLAWGLARLMKLESLQTLSRRQWLMLAGIVVLTIGGFLIAMPATYGLLS